MSLLKITVCCKSSECSAEETLKTGQHVQGIATSRLMDSRFSPAAIILVFLTAGLIEPWIVEVLILNPSPISTSSQCRLFGLFPASLTTSSRESLTNTCIHMPQMIPFSCRCTSSPPPQSPSSDHELAEILWGDENGASHSALICDSHGEQQISPQSLTWFVRQATVAAELTPALLAKNTSPSVCSKGVTKAGNPTAM